jgi:hypothetical protein
MDMVKKALIDSSSMADSGRELDPRFRAYPCDSHRADKGSVFQDACGRLLDLFPAAQAIEAWTGFSAHSYSLIPRYFVSKYFVPEHLVSKHLGP